MLRRRRRLTNKTSDCLKKLINTSMPPCVEVLGLQSDANSSLWHVWFGLVWSSYSVSAAYCAAMPGVAGCGRQRTRRPTSSLQRDQLSPRPAVFHQPLSTYALISHLDTGSTNCML